HDVSELPLVAVLAASVEAAGVPKEKLIVIDQGSNWAYPETTRM
ncbi:MAG: Nif3-like dinuclear metal center hexameric protein, partial [Raoultibacter sp.]